MTYDELVAAVTNYTENTVETSVMNTFIMQAEQRIYNTVQFPSLRKNVTGVTTSGNKYLSCPSDFLSTFSMAVVDANGNYEYLLNKDVNFIRQAYPQPNDTALPKYYALFGPTTTSGTTPTITNELSFILGPTPDAAYDVELHYYYYPASIVPTQGIVVTLTNQNLTTEFDGVYSVSLDGTSGSGTGLILNVTVENKNPTSIDIASGGSGYAVGDYVYTTSIYPVTVSATVETVTAGTGTSTTWLSDNFDTVLLYGTLVEAYTYMKGEQDMMALYDGKYKEALALAQRLGDGLERSDAYRSGQFRLPPLPPNNGVR